MSLIATPCTTPSPPAVPDDARADRGATEPARRPNRARPAGPRRRYVDPSTCERQYTAAEREFVLAMQAYKRASGRMFPTWSEVLEVLRGLGYEKVAGSA
jgi:hypothetical protein